MSSPINVLLHHSASHPSSTTAVAPLAPKLRIEQPLQCLHHSLFLFLFSRFITVSTYHLHSHNFTDAATSTVSNHFSSPYCHHHTTAITTNAITNACRYCYYPPPHNINSTTTATLSPQFLLTLTAALPHHCYLLPTYRSLPSLPPSLLITHHNPLLQPTTSAVRHCILYHHYH